MLISRSEMLLLRSFVIFTLTASAFGQGTSRYESDLDTIADRLTHEVQLTRKHDFSPKVLVIDFLDQKGQVNALGEHLADQLSNALVEKVGPAYVVARKQFREHLLSTGISPFDLQDIDAARWTAREAGANVIVFGYLISSQQKATLRVELVRVSDAKRLSKAGTDLSLAEEARVLFDKPLDWPASPDVVVSCRGAQRDEVIATFKAAGVREPKCIHCPIPSYPDGARAAGHQGAVKVKIVIDDQGRPKSGIIIQGNSPDLEAQAIRAIKEWRFEPAMKDGKPVPVCTIADVMFLSY
jgi:TonB family protein